MAGAAAWTYQVPVDGPVDGHVGGAVAVVVGGHGDVAGVAPHHGLRRCGLDVPGAGRGPVDGHVGGAVAVVVAGHGDVAVRCPTPRPLGVAVAQVPGAVGGPVDGTSVVPLPSKSATAFPPPPPGSTWVWSAVVMRTGSTPRTWAVPLASWLVWTPSDGVTSDGIRTAVAV